jgi:2-polyprenyl-3-methyl-5-hydroxy-6-metoxy-1,4-benzoquinol methylase
MTRSNHAAAAAVVPDASPDGSSTFQYTPLDRFLTARRAARADRLIPASLRGGRVLDVGCGRHPVFLAQTRFAAKVGLDHVAPLDPPADARFVVFDLEHSAALPFRDDSFDVVTMLAVLEHVGQERIVPLLDDIFRTIRPGGALVLTTPPPWTDAVVLKVLAGAHLVSRQLVDDHEETFTPGELEALFDRTRFGSKRLRLGYFQLFMNIWAVARKP